MMNIIRDRNSFFIGVWALTSVLVFAGTYQEMQLKSLSFMDDSEIQYESHATNAVRVVASSDHARPRVQYLGVNEKNQKIIEGDWEVVRIVDVQGVEIFNKNYRDQDKNKFIKINLEMIGTSQVRLNDDHRQIFLISLLTEFNTIVLFKSIKDGYEILEAKKLVLGKTNLATQNIKNDIATQEIENTQDEKEMEDGIYAELMLEKALHPSVSGEVIAGDAISGNVIVTGGSIESFNVTLHRGTDKQTSLDFSFANINDGGQFEVDFGEERINGIITQNGENGYRVRFATGPLAGAVLSFLTNDEFEKVENQIAEDKLNKELNEESDVTKEAVAVQEEAVIERERINNEVNYSAGIYEVDSTYYEEDENYDRPEEITNPMAQAQKIEDTGFNF